MAKKQRIINYTLTKRIEQQYGRDLYNVSSEVDRMVNSFIRRIDTSKERIEIEDVSDLIEKLQEYSEKIQDWASRTANRMIYSLESQDLKQWEQHSKKMSVLMKQQLKQADIKRIMNQYMNDNVRLITSLPLNAAQRVHDLVTQNLVTGKRASSVAKEIMKTGQVTQSRANLIARTETSRAVTGLVMARAESIGLDWFCWKSTGGFSGDGRTRKAHRKMEGVVMKWDTPPNPELLFPEPKVKAYGNYLPGATFNCRCWCLPLIRASSDISWPARVYTSGKIQKMTLKQFLDFSGQEFYRKVA